MTAVGRTPQQRPAARERPTAGERRKTRGRPVPSPQQRRPTAAARAAPPSRLPISVVTLIASLGVFVASAAFAAGRMGYASSPWADRAYWLGQALVVAPVAGRLLSRRPLSQAGTATLIVVLTVAEYLLKICYSPLSFTFTDELLHWRSTVNVLQTGKLFTANWGLPISPRYPGLEEAASALVSVTGMPIFVAGLIIAGIAHLLFICFLYLSFWCFTRSYRIAGIAILVYNATPTLDSFDAMFIYETLALAFLGLSVLAAWRTVTGRSGWERTRWFILALLATAATAVTHHVTSYMLAGSLFLVTLASLITRTGGTARRIGALAVFSAAAIACWIVFITPDTLSYFRPTVEGLVQGLNSLQNGTSSGARSTSSAPFGNQVLEGAVVLLVTALLPLGWRQAWKRHRRHPWIVAMAIGSLGWFVALALRVGTPDGQEIAGRTATFVYMPVSLMAGLALIRLVNVALARRWESAAIALAVIGALTLLFDGLANGWPPYWERLPGQHQVAGFERSVGPEEIAAARWTLTALGPGNRFAADIGIYPALIGYGDQNPLQGVGYLYSTPAYTPAIARAARAQAVQYVLADRRLSQSPSASGTYFPGSSTTGNGPIPLTDLTKFNRVPGAARVFDDGNIVIYNLQGAQSAP